MDLHFSIVRLLFFVSFMVKYCQSQAIEQCPALCSTRPCPESEDEHCLEWDDWGQCLSCEEGYFHKHVGSPCVSCTETFGSSCNYCINNYGCGSCNCYELVHDIVCNLRFCGIENDDESSTLIDSCDDTDEDTEDTTEDTTDDATDTSDTSDTSYTNSDESTDLTDSVISDSTDSIDTNSGNSNNNNIDDDSSQSGGSVGSNGSGVSQNGDGDDEKSKKPSADGVYVFVVVLCLAAVVPCMKMYKNRTSNSNQQMNGPNGVNRSTSIQMTRPQLRPTQSMQSVHSMHSVGSHQSHNSIHSMHSIQSSQSNNSYNSYNSSNIDDNIWAQRARKSTIEKKAKLARQNSTKPMINDGVAVAVYS